MSQTNLIEGIDYYFGEDGLLVFTEHYHLQKGHCCGHGCRHCPYDFDSVPEPKRSALINEQEKRKAQNDSSQRP